jgi:hypothetical protein
MGLYDDAKETARLGLWSRQISQDEAAELIRRSAGRYFSCTFTKADGTTREMHCRWCTAREVKEHRERIGCVTVFEDAVEDWRTICLARLHELRIDGKTFEVTR